MLYALLPRASFCIFNGWAEASKLQSRERKHFSSKFYCGAFVSMFSDSPFPNIMTVLGPHGMVQCGIGLGERWLGIMVGWII
jgi:hypothetical protein